MFGAAEAGADDKSKGPAEGIDGGGEGAAESGFFFASGVHGAVRTLIFILLRGGAGRDEDSEKNRSG